MDEAIFDNASLRNTTCAGGSNSDDNDGDNFTCPGNFPENVLPTITLTSPAQGQTFAHGETIIISALQLLAEFFCSANANAPCKFVIKRI